MEQIDRIIKKVKKIDVSKHRGLGRFGSAGASITKSEVLAILEKEAKK